MARMNKQAGRGRSPNYMGNRSHYLHAATEAELREQIKIEVLHNPHLGEPVVEEMPQQQPGLIGRWRAHWDR